MSDYLHDLFSLEGQTALVIGGTGELCGAMAEGLAGAGAEVILVGRSEEKASARLAKIEAAGGSGYFLAADVGSRESLEKLLAEATARSGQVDILVNGAGANSATPFFDIPEDEFRQILDVNLKAVFDVSQIFGKYFVDSKVPASIINVGSMSGVVPLSRVFTYSLTKAAVHNLSKNLAREWAPHGIRVNTLVPGFFPAEQNKKILQPERVEKIMGHTPMNRFGESHELIGATLLLASNKAGGFITGHEMIVDGGYSSMTI
ncbi:MAG: SDR family oxidoreductase [Verrucomicrobiota bacterium]